MDPYFLHKLALSPLLSSNPREELKTIALQIKGIGEATFLSFLAFNMLTPLWHESLAEHDAASFFSDDFTGKLKKASLVAAGRYLQQQHAVDQATKILEAESMPYVVYKGAHIREIIYSNPAVRAADDVDILISKSDREKALLALAKSGYELNLNPETISHEAVASDSNVKLDFHWDILRPGRTRTDMTEELLATRQKHKNQSVLSNEAELFIMLVHPVITKYLTAPHASLIRVIDMLKWVETQEIDWGKIYELLEKSGLKTAAWINAYWLKLLTGRTLPEKILIHLKPSTLKGIYLQNWINKNYSTKFLKKPLLIKAFFTLPVHDKLPDAYRAVRVAQKEKGIAQAETEKLKSAADQ